ncbi:MAG: DEAD/DEAH box helicase [Aureliella sp.]
MQLRPYQQAAIDAVYSHLRHRDDNPCVVIPTAGGKTPIIASICRDAVTRWSGRVLILAHVKELLAQAADKLKAMAPDLDVGVYSAGLGSRDTKGDVLIAGIQSVHQRAAKLGRFALVLVDECHLIPASGDGMYRRFLDDAKHINPHLRVVGFTATPYRLDSGSICSEDGPLHRTCFEVGVLELIRDGYLCRPIAKAGEVKADTSKLHVRGGEFVASEAEALMDTERLVASAGREIVDATQDRHSCLIFAAGVDHAASIADAMRIGLGVDCEIVTGETSSDERARILHEFRQRQLKYLVNVNVLTTGFDAPNIDCVALLRPTMSPGLFYQMVGRGFRLHPGKQDCLILDFAGNVLRHGPVDCIVPKNDRPSDGKAVAKECPECRRLIASGFSACPECGYDFQVESHDPHEATTTGGGILSTDISVTEYAVQDIMYRVHVKRDAPEDAPRTLRVDYQIGLDHWQSEFVCIEHTGYARKKAESWWRERSPDPFPDSTDQAVTIAEAGGVAYTESITVRSVPGEPYDTIVGHRLAPIPEPADTIRSSNSDVPF